MSHLNLAPSNPLHDDAGPFAFACRRVERWPLDGVATAICVAGEDFGRIHEFAMINYSHDGMGASCRTPVGIGTQLTIGFQAAGYPAKRGHVVRCVKDDEGYWVAIQFEAKLAA